MPQSWIWRLSFGSCLSRNLSVGLTSFWQVLCFSWEMVSSSSIWWSWSWSWPISCELAWPAWFMWLLSFFRHWMSSSAFSSCNHKVTHHKKTKYWGLVYNIQIQSHNLQQDKILVLVYNILSLRQNVLFIIKKDSKELVHGKKYLVKNFKMFSCSQIRIYSNWTCTVLNND